MKSKELFVDLCDEIAARHKSEKTDSKTLRSLDDHEMDTLDSSSNLPKSVNN